MPNCANIRLRTISQSLRSHRGTRILIYSQNLTRRNSAGSPNTDTVQKIDRAERRNRTKDLLPHRHQYRRHIIEGDEIFGHSVNVAAPTAQVTAPTTPANTISIPSPVVLTMRPPCSEIGGSTISRQRPSFSGFYLMSAGPRHPCV